MGMYNIVKFDYDVQLPEFEGEDPIHGWQSKDIEPNALETLRITEDGKLLREECRYEEVPEEERPYPDADDDSLLKLAGSLKKITEGWDEIGYHGDMRVVGIDSENFYEYKIRFTDGRLESVELTDKHERNDKNAM